MTVSTLDGRIVEIDEKTSKLYDFCNETRTIIYNAERLESDKPSGFWVDYQVEGTIDDVETKMLTWNNPVKLAYAKAVDFNASENDPDKVIWSKTVELVKSNEKKFFNHFGDWKKSVRFNIDEDRIEIASNRGGKREGAGRKPSAEPKKSTWSVRVTEEEKEALQKALDKMRGLR